MQQQVSCDPSQHPLAQAIMTVRPAYEQSGIELLGDGPDLGRIVASCGHSARGGSGRRSAASSASEHTPDMAARIAVSATGSMAETASRVAGSVPPKIAMPTKPSTRPRRSRDRAGEDSCDKEGEDMAREVANLRACVQHSPATHGGHA